MLVEPGDSQSLLVELCKKRHKGLVKSFLQASVWKILKIKQKQEGVTPGNSSKPFYSVRNFGVLETWVLLQFFPENYFFLYWEGMHHVYASIPRLSNQGEELRAGTGSLNGAVSLQEWWKLRCVLVFVTVFSSILQYLQSKQHPVLGSWICAFCLFPQKPQGQFGKRELSSHHSSWADPHQTAGERAPEI